MSAISRALANGDLRQSRLGELGVTTGADLVGALAACSEFGSALIRLFDANDVTAHEPATTLLAERIARRHKDVVAVEVVRLALYELMFPRCQTCDGRGWCNDFSGVNRQCFTCDGSGRKRYTNGERARFVGQRAWNKAADNALMDAVAEITLAYQQSKATVKREVSEVKR
jgi:hypothetical protein